MSTQGSVRTGRAAIRSRTVRLAGQRSVGRGDTRGSCRLPGSAREQADGQLRGPSDSYSEGPRCVAAQGIPAYAGEPGTTGRVPTGSVNCPRSGVHRSLHLGRCPTTPRVRKDLHGARHRHHLAVRLGPLVPSHGAGVDHRSRAARRPRHLLHDGLHRGAQPADHRHREGRQTSSSSAAPTASSSRSRMVTAATALCAGLLTILDGRRRPLPDRDRRGPRAQRLRRVHPRAADDVGRRDGPRRRSRASSSRSLVLTGFRTAVFHAVPEQLKYAIGVGIGLFITIIGFVDAGITRTGRPLITFGIDGALRGWPTFVFVFGLLLTAVLVARKVARRDPHRHRRHAPLLADHHRGDREGRPAVRCRRQRSPTRIGWSLNVPSWPTIVVVDARTSALIGQFNLFGGFQAIGVRRGRRSRSSRSCSATSSTRWARSSAWPTRARSSTRTATPPHLEAILLVDSVGRGRRWCRQRLEQHQLHRVGLGRR